MRAANCKNDLLGIEGGCPEATLPPMSAMSVSSGGFCTFGLVVPRTMPYSYEGEHLLKYSDYRGDSVNRRLLFTEH
ncbi:Hypothetical protein NTJ_01640 [Nesidiocoris tenuis]|uniref:Uncharacterized protein n=1 Tax=Nesidiocoris tenuis TaxID=355587 RepID=A0ABN7AA04_9HEMI|nr:Hypothetical protein NTJ_01640 [Nesidiocoris tenuis]